MRALLIALGVTAILWLVTVIVLFLAGRTVAAKELVTVVPNLLRLFRALIGDPRVPRGSKVVLGVALVWIASPIDLLPEFLPVIGPLDDVIVAALALRHLLRRAGPEPIRDHWRGDPHTLELVLRAAGLGPI